MAQKRMFDRAIIDTDKFMDMTLESKALYFLLGMEADDEGFVSYKKVMRVHGGQEDAIKILAAKGFIIIFPTGVTVITDWNKNNWLDTRRTRPTEYQKEKALLSLTNDKVYVLSNGLASIEEYRVEENRIEENRIVNLPLKKEKVIAKDKPLRLDSEPYSFQDFYEDMRKSPQRHINIIGEYADEIKANFTTRGQWRSFVTRNVRAAKLVSPFTDEQISIAMGKIKGEKFLTSWTLETLLKYLTK